MISVRRNLWVYGVVPSGEVLIDPRDVKDWDEYYSEVYSLDDVLEESQETVTDACAFIDAFTERFHYDIVNYFMHRWIRLNIRREAYCFSKTVSFPNVFNLVSAYAAERPIDVSPKVAHEANAISSKYQAVVQKIKKRALEAISEWETAQAELLEKTLVEKVHSGSCDAVVYLGLDDVHYLRMVSEDGKIDSTGVESVEIPSKSLKKTLKAEGKKQGCDVYVVRPSSENLRLDALMGYIKDVVLAHGDEDDEPCQDQQAQD